MPRLAHDRIQHGGTRSRRAGQGETKPSQVEVFATGISANDFVSWFEAINKQNDEAQSLAAHPEHYIIDAAEPETQTVTETTGGAPLPTAFSIKFGPTPSLEAKTKPNYPFGIIGRCVLDNGKMAGAAIHQFEDTPDGLHGVLHIEFPALAPQRIVSGHKRHLAIEFGNWIEAASIGGFDP